MSLPVRLLAVCGRATLRSVLLPVGSLAAAHTPRLATRTSCRVRGPHHRVVHLHDQPGRQRLRGHAVVPSRTRRGRTVNRAPPRLRRASRPAGNRAPPRLRRASRPAGNRAPPRLRRASRPAGNRAPPGLRRASRPGGSRVGNADSEPVPASRRRPARSLPDGHDAGGCGVRTGLETEGQDRRRPMSRTVRPASSGMPRAA